MKLNEYKSKMKKVGIYRVLLDEELGRGASSTVYKGNKVEM